jgi:hypothetical protein
MICANCSPLSHDYLMIKFINAIIIRPIKLTVFFLFFRIRFLHTHAGCDFHHVAASKDMGMFTVQNHIYKTGVGVENNCVA